MTNWVKGYDDLHSFIERHGFTGMEAILWELLQRRANANIYAAFAEEMTPEEMEEGGLIEVSPSSCWVLVGALEVRAAASLVHFKGYKRALDKLEKAGLIRQVDGGVFVNRKGQQTPDQLFNERGKTRKRGKRYRDSHRGKASKASDNGVTNGVTPQDDNGVTNASRVEETNSLQELGDSTSRYASGSTDSAEAPSARVGGKDEIPVDDTTTPELIGLEKLMGKDE